MDEKFLLKAIEIAETSGIDIPVGAVIVKDGEIISSSCNKKELLNDVTAHAEILAIREAEKFLNNWRLSGCDMYVTLEPCPMCLWAIMNARLDNLYFGSYDKVYGGISSSASVLYQLANSKMAFKGGILEEKCDNLLNSYFEKLR